MCCLRYEHESYIELRRGLPNPGERIVSPEGPAIVIDNNVLLESVKARLINCEDGKEMDLSDDVYIFHKGEIVRTSNTETEKETEDFEDFEDIEDIYE